MRGTITKHGPNRWRLRYDLPMGADGKRRQRMVTVRGSRKEAEAELARLVSEAERGTAIDPARVTLAEYVEEHWLAHVKERKAPRTLEIYRSLLAWHVLPALGRVRLGKISALQVEELYRRLLREGRKDGTGGLSPQTVRHVHNVLHGALTQAVRWRLLEANPLAHVEPPRAARYEGQALTPELLARLLEAAQEAEAEGRCYLFVPILLAGVAALRRGEVLGLTWDDVDLTAGTLTVRRSLGARGEISEPKSAAGRRRIRLPAFLLAELARHKGRQAEHRLRVGPAWEDHNAVTTQPNGRPYLGNSLTHAFRRLADRAGLPAGFTFHGLRHTSATLQILAGTDLKTVSSRLGHSGIAITANLYAHVLEQHDRNAAEALDNLLSPHLGRAR